MSTSTLESDATIEGWLEGVRTNAIGGWAWDRAEPRERLDVQIWLGDEKLALVRADRERPDLEKIGIGDGRHGFRFTPDEPLAEADLGRVSVTVQRGTSSEIRLRRLGEELSMSEVERAIRRLNDVLRALAAQQEQANDATSAALRALVDRIDALVKQVEGGRLDDRRLHPVEQEFERRLATLEAVQARLDELILKELAAAAGPREGARTNRAGLAVVAVVAALLIGSVIGFVARGL